MSNYRLVDGNSVGRAAHAATVLKAGGMQTQAIFNVVKAAREMKFFRRDFEPIFLWDGRAQWRYDLHPDYKSNRSSDAKKVADKKAYEEQVPFIRKALSYLGIRQMLATTHEADDLAGYLVSSIRQRDPMAKILLTTGDEDWAQLVRHGVTWEDHRDREKTITLANLMDKTGFRTPYGFLEGKCLKGDSSDVIPGVGGIGAKGAPEFIAEFGSVREFWRRVDAGEFKPRLKAHQNLASPEGRARFAKNLRIMQLLQVQAPKRDDVVPLPVEYDEEKFMDLCRQFSFLSILRNEENFLAPFRSK